MPRAIPHLMAAEMDGDFVVFLIGMRINRIWKIHKWAPVLFAMFKMLRELKQHRESGSLGHFGGGAYRLLLSVQYWRSFEHLESYARSHDRLHWPAWVRFNEHVAKSRGDVGIWHETYRAQAGSYEAVYSGMPPFGLGGVGTLLPATGARNSARARVSGTSGLRNGAESEGPRGV